MAKDDIDSFVTDMKTLASILGHNDDVVMEKFKDVFPDKNIEAALIGMNHEGDAPSVKPKVAKSKLSNQHQLAPTQNTGPTKQGNPQGQTRGGYKNNNPGSQPGQSNDGYYHQNNFRNSTYGSSGRGIRGQG